MATISGPECQAWRSERYFNIRRYMVEMLAKGKRVPSEKTSGVITEKESLIFKTTRKANIISHEQKFAPEFEKCAGKKADTKSIFERVIGRKKTHEEIASL